MHGCGHSGWSGFLPGLDEKVQGFSGPLSQKSDENPRMRVIPHSKFPPKCADSRRFFVTTDLKNPVASYSIAKKIRT